MTDSPAFEPSKGGVVGQPVNRVDGHAKVTGQAQYAAEYLLPNLTYAALKTSSIAKGRLKSIDTAAALREPGVLAVFTHENLPKMAQTPNTLAGKYAIYGMHMAFMPLTGNEIFYSAQPVAVVVADTFERATQAAALVQVTYEEARPVASYQSANAEVFDPNGQGYVFDLKKVVRGNPQASLAASAVQVKATYVHPINHHNPMEPGATIAHWEAPDRVTVYDSTQAVAMAQSSLATILGLPQEQVRVVTKFIGGGFGCKFNLWPHTVLATLAAKAVGRPVKLVLTRQQMFTSLGHREDQEQTITLGARQDGKLTTLIHEKTSTTSPWDIFAEPNGAILNWLYACPNYQSSHRVARANVMTSTYMRAPGESPGSVAMECGLDELAAKLGLDPLEIRLRNYANLDPGTGQPWSSKGLKECYARGAELFGWSKRSLEPGVTRDGRLLVGWGMATASYPVRPAQGRARVRLYADGHALVQTSATDLGTGTYTVITQVAADALGLPMANVRFELGDSNLPTAPASGSSVAAATVSSSVYLAIQDVWQRLTALAVRDSQSPLFKALPADVVREQDQLVLKKNPSKREKFSALLQRQGLADIEGVGNSKSGEGYEADQIAFDNKPGTKQTKRSMYSFGVHFCEVKVDPDLGTVHVTRWVSVMDGGRILNSKTARSQIIGGSIMGIGAALMEGTNRDEQYARYTNADLAGYHVPINADIPDMQVEFIDGHDPYVNAMGVKGIGEVAMVGTVAAVANAVYHATGKRVRSFPIVPSKVLGSDAV
ncbi:xanthine dehydrogenase family protein molybdopterin-binding subunit [Hymenobacter wooponensis]|uniref:Xanthine dehydrogenase family protein molybdopterin-binding subunit n=1 Tax=Hymenobacter wooponensis TaxID=1525360 RepID=A0A4Z0MDV3_9BACT|nr:xanthine dehydrogenase family protein molybdopterin-binding subunit [Hymenobacter wooponensis]TGD77696.1 xanthine dehydrogenase family protein molybdopterin-binding subunit [Hymenobacter wooponensis]